MSAFFTFIFGLLLLGVAASGFLFVLRRKFYRKNSAGVEEFNNFSQSVKANVLEFVILTISALVLLYAIFVIAVAFD